jgi:predicted aspartyl protease
VVEGNFRVPIKLNNQRYMGLWDTGSTVSLINCETAKQLLCKIKPAAFRATSVTGHVLKIVGQATLNINLGGKAQQHTFGVLDDPQAEKVLLGTDYMSKVGPYMLDLKNEYLKLTTGGRVVKIRLTATGPQ